MIIERRSFVGGLIGLVAAPAIVKAASLMPLRGEKLIMPPKVIVPRSRRLRITTVAWEVRTDRPLMSKISCAEPEDPKLMDCVTFNIWGIHDLRPGDYITVNDRNTGQPVFAYSGD